jgi:hypothetical protein
MALIRVRRGRDTSLVLEHGSVYDQERAGGRSGNQQQESGRQSGRSYASGDWLRLSSSHSGSGRSGRTNA